MNTIPRSHTARIILRNNHENLVMIRSVEHVIRSFRPAVFRMPKPGSEVVLLLSGGMDSTAAWDTLMSRYKLIVYPIAVRRSVFDPQINSIRKLSRYFQHKYPNRYRIPKIIRWDEFGGLLSQLSHTFASGDMLLDYLAPGTSIVESPGSGANVFFALHAALYAQTLSVVLERHVSTVFYGVTSDDGGHIRTQTFSFLRLMMLVLMRFTGDNNFQFSSPFYEPQLGAFFTKRDVLQRAVRLRVPIQITYSCDKKGLLHCGVCISCQSRKFCFEKSGIVDPTWYMDPESIRARVKRILRLN